MCTWSKLLARISLIVLLGLVPLGGAEAFEAEDLSFGFGSDGWQSGLGLSQESVKPLGFFGYEKTGIGGYVSVNQSADQLSSWFGGHKQVLMGNISYTLELFAGNTQRPVLATFMSNMDPHVGAFGDFSRMYGDFGHGLTATAQLFVNNDNHNQLEYSISPYMQFTRDGVWRISLSLGHSLGLGFSYLEPMERVKFNVTFFNEMLRFHVLVAIPEYPTTFGAGWSDDKIQAFIRYVF